MKDGIVRRVLSFFGIIRKMENRTAIEAKIDELNRVSAGMPLKPASGTLAGVLFSPAVMPPQIWQEFPGYNSLTKFDYNNGSPTFSPSVGIPIKAFLNTRTGEIKTFVASIFEK